MISAKYPELDGGLICSGPRGDRAFHASEEILPSGGVFQSRVPVVATTAVFRDRSGLRKIPFAFPDAAE